MDRLLWQGSGRGHGGWQGDSRAGGDYARTTDCAYGGDQQNGEPYSLHDRRRYSLGTLQCEKGLKAPAVRFPWIILSLSKDEAHDLAASYPDDGIENTTPA